MIPFLFILLLLASLVAGQSSTENLEKLKSLLSQISDLTQAAKSILSPEQGIVGTAASPMGQIAGQDKNENVKKTNKLLNQLSLMTWLAKCNRNRQQEWNHAISVRHAKRKAELGLTTDKCFTGLKESDGGPSGASSSFIASKELRGLLQEIFRNESLGVKSVFDAACGDWVYMQHVDLSNIAYIGGDISEVTVAENMRCFSKENVQFVHYDLLCHTPPDVDLMLLRDVLFHFKDHFILKALRNIMSSKVRYLLTTTFLTENDDHQWQRDRAYAETNHLRGENSTVGFREVNLMDRPFCLPPPLLRIVDSANLYASLGQPTRYVGLWKLPVPLDVCPDNDVN